MGKGELQGGNSNLGHPLLRSSRSKSRDGNMCIFAYIRRARCNCSGTRHLLPDAVKTATAGQYGIAHQSDNIPPGKKRLDRKSTLLTSSHYCATRMPSSA